MVMMRTKKEIQLEICEAEEQFLFFQKYNRLSDARLERLKIEELDRELEENENEESAERFCYE